MVFDLLDEYLYATEGNNNNITRLVMNFTGQVQFWQWKNETGWYLSWSQPKDGCSLYQICGNFSICYSNYNSGLRCKCLQGFTPSSPKGWNSRDYSEGCLPNPSSSCSTEDSFLRMPMMRVNNPSFNNTALETCKSACLSDCHCIAYSCGIADCKETSNEICLMWSNVLTDLQKDYPDGLTIFIRRTDRSARVPFSFKVVVLCGAVLLAAILVYGLFLTFHMHRSMSDELQSSVRFEGDDTEGIDVPLFGWESILAATNNFSEANKLGIGGFGSVYRGKLPNGQEIAVKRLLSVTVHSFEEFKTEIKLIAKLQHRNLVRLVGYCMKANEKILVYEYMPNGSLDSCLFDEKHSVLLDWKKRFDIILGIARGLLYLHQDSRLRIIHRDLKPGNILLDEDLNPKISDFGLAKIVGVKETEASTGRIYGTYGYMSPEYASDGIFSFKSDVFSFGVVMLETISGKKNSRIFMLEHGLSLLGHAWKLCNEDKGLELLDTKLKESCCPSEVLKCINVALLCVQDDPSDRPSISTIVQILTNGASLPFAARPASMYRKPFLETASSSSAKDSSFRELITIPTVGR